ncbi:MAG: hypothetical protein FWG63_07075 [Defluviitaleaceae bacterium]|nr:hypothetical protein [Defluviitaleaceae bacterium]
MLVLFDLQDSLERIDVGTPLRNGFLVANEKSAPILTVTEHDDVKFILVSDRNTITKGAMLQLFHLPSIQSGDRLVITGRISKKAPHDGWGISLFSIIDPTIHPVNIESNVLQLSQQVAPQGIYTLVHQFDTTENYELLSIETTQWQNYIPTMDFSIDSILVTRITDSMKFIKDKRSTVYSLETDEEIRSLIAGADIDTNLTYLQRSGTSLVQIVKSDDKTTIHIKLRSKDYDGIDIRLEEMGLIRGNNYNVKVFGYVDGRADKDSQITLQGLPGFHWRGTQPLFSNTPFVLSYTLMKSHVGRWTDLRIATNAAGATAPLVINALEVTVEDDDNG